MEYNVGLIWSGDEEHSTVIKQDENGVFLNTEEELKDWVYALTHPWSNTSMHYEATPNYQGEGWIARKTVVVYDNLDAVVATQGSTPQEAITACEDFIKELSDKYGNQEEE